tara:strand:- start:70 stop:459 length:390 start_codon:yes stop_codon:yes gene_type:complete
MSNTKETIWSKNRKENIDFLKMDIEELEIQRLQTEQLLDVFQKEKLEHNRNNFKWLNDDERIILKEFLNWLHNGENESRKNVNLPFYQDYDELMILYKKAMNFAYEEVYLTNKIYKFTKAIEIKTKQKK